MNTNHIFALLEQLCNIYTTSTERKREVLRNVTRYFSNHTNAMGTILPHDEATLVDKILNHINNRTTVSVLAQNSSGDVRVENEESAAEQFLNMNEQLKSSLLESRQRRALLTFLYFMADFKNSCDNGYKSIVLNSNENSKLHVNSLLKQPNRSYILHKTNLTEFTGHGLNRVINNQSTAYIKEHNSKIASIRTNPSRISSDNESLGYGLSPNTALLADTSKYGDFHNSQNDDIVQNIIYAFTGIQGEYLKKDVISGKFKLDLKARSLNIVQAGMILRLSELGYYHDKVKSYTDSQSGLCALGLMGQGFVSALKNELTKYYGMVATLQEQLKNQQSLEKNYYSATSAPERLTPLKLYSWAVDPLHRLRWLSTIAQQCQEKKGGALASTVHTYLGNGSPLVKSLVRDLLLSLCGPMYQMLTRWLLEGEICDPHGEYFIECLSDVGPDRLWHDKYRIRYAMLPDFISPDMAHKILVTGKSINFLCEVCEDTQPVKGNDELKLCIEKNPENIFANVADTALHSTIDSIYLNTSKRVLDIVMGPHKLLEHLQAMRRYLLLGQGDFIGILMENLKCELDKPAKELYCYDLSSIMDAAIRSTNAQYDDPEILNHLDVRLMTPCDGDVGWDILSLQYTVRGPLATMLEPCMGTYQVLFKPLWRMKHMEFVLSSKIWKDQKCNAKSLRPMNAELNKVLYRLHLFTSEMIHFIHQMQYYILFEVIECSWAELQKRVQQAKALDDILNAHKEFLDTIRCGAFLDTSSGQLCQNMETVYEGIAHLEMWQNKFYELCFKELHARKVFEANIIASEKTGNFGTDVEKKFQRDQEHKIFEQTITGYQKSLENIGSNYEKAVRCFLLNLNSNKDHNLQLFGIRLDFNDYYKKRDQRLGIPLTFEHMRYSNVFFNINKGPLGSRYSALN